MKRLFAYHRRWNFVWPVIIPLLLIAPAGSTIAAELKEAHVTRIIKEVQLLPAQAAPRPAAVNDNVRSGTAVRTGADSRTELTFTDLTLARLGANTIFSFNEGTRNLDLGGGAVLLQVPKGAGGAKITTAAVTAGITGTTVLMEYHRNAYIKFIVLEGTARMYLKNRLGESVLIGPGQMLIVNPNAKSLPDPVHVDLKRLVQTCLLITEFAPLASQPLILQQIQIQQNNRDLIPTNLVIYGGGTLVSLVDPTNLNVISQETTAVATPTPSPTPVPTPSKFGTPSVITSPVPYVITSGTTISTDPAITTNGVTDFGKIWRGQAQDGPLSAFIFGSTSAFDTASGFDTELNGQNSNGGAGFKFTSLRLTGNPTVSTPTSVMNLGLIVVNGITSGGPGGTLTFAGIRGLLIATQDGSINLGPEIAFSGIHDINFYARGAGSNLTLGSAISGGTRIRLWAQGTIQINGDESAATDFRAFSGGDFLAGTGTVTATDINIQSLSNVNIGGSLTSEILNILSAGDLNIGLNNPVTINAVTISLSAANNLNWSGDSFSATAVNSSGDVNISAGQGINITSDLIEHRFTARPIGANISFDAGTDLSVGGQLDLRTSVGSDSGGNISVAAAQDITVGGLLFLRSNIRFDATSGNEIMLNVGGTVNAGSLSGSVSVEQTNSALGTGGNISIQTGNDLTITGAAPLLNGGVGIDLAIIPGEATLGGVGSINTGGNIHLTVGGKLTTPADGLLNLFIANSGAHIGTGGNIFASVSGNVTAGHIDTDVNTHNRGSIGTGGNTTLSFGGDVTTNGFDFFTIHNANGGIISTGGNIFVSINGNYTSGRIEASIDNSNGGTIGSGANITLNVRGTMSSSADAFFTIDNSNGGVIRSRPAINVNANNINFGINSGLFAWIDDSTNGGPPSGTTGTVTIHANGTINVAETIDVLGQVSAGGDITTGFLESTNVTTPGNIIVGNGGISRFNQPFTHQFPNVLHTLTAASVTSQGGINFNGIDGTGSTAPTDGGQLTINANSLNIGTDIVGPVTFDGGSGANSMSGGANGGTFTVNTTGPITVNSDIEATSGNQPIALAPAGDGGTVNFNLTNGTVTVNNRIEVSSIPPDTNPPVVRRSARGGNIHVTSGKAGAIGARAVAINVGSSAQLLALLDAAAPGPGGQITILATGANSDVNVNGRVQADRGGVDIRHTGDSGNVNLTNADVRADIVKVAALGNNGTLNIGGGTLSADTTLKLYAPGSNGAVNFIANVTLSGASQKIIAGNSVTIFNNVAVTIQGQNPASVFTNSANYSRLNGGNGSTTGIFAGAGANNPQPLANAPPLGPPGGP